MSYIPIADQKDEMHDPHSFVAKYVWSMDHKVIAIQYGTIAVGVGLVALVLSALILLLSLIQPSITSMSPCMA
jgi:cytochrome c oxidase subunit 1